MLGVIEMYNVPCELRVVQGRDKENTVTGRLLATFKAKVFRKSIGSDFVGTGTASNGYDISIQYKYFGVDILPQKHCIVMENKGYVIANVQQVNMPFNSNRPVRGKTIMRLVLQ